MKLYDDEDKADEDMRKNEVYLPRRCPFTPNGVKNCGNWCPFFSHEGLRVRLSCTGQTRLIVVEE